MLGLLNGLLSGFARFLMGLQDLAIFSGRVIVRCFRPPFYLRDTYEQAYHSGVGSLHLALISAFFAGQALGLQFSRQLAETGSTTLLGMLMTISVVRALGPDLIGLVVAARLASGFTAEIGAMKSANQIDALVAFGTDPIRKLAVPRFVALIFMLPMLVILGDLIALIGGAIMAHFVAHRRRGIVPHRGNVALDGYVPGCATRAELPDGRRAGQRVRGFQFIQNLSQGRGLAPGFAV